MRINKPNDVFKRIDLNPIPPCTCWLWTGSVNDKGIPYFMIGGKNIIAYRLVYWITHPAWDINDALDVIRHQCTDEHGNAVDNPRCCNPQHLTTGTQQQNIMDMMLRGRRGLRSDALRDILDLGDDTKQHAIKLTHKEIAQLVSAKYEIAIARTTVTDILSGRRRLVMRQEMAKRDRAIANSGKQKENTHGSE